MDTNETTESSTTFYFSESSDSLSDEDCHSGFRDDRLDTRTYEKKQEEYDESPLHSLESEAHGITIQRYISKYMDHGLDESFIRETKKRKERENLSRSMKAAMNHTFYERIFPDREQSHSAGNLTVLLSSSSPTNNSIHSSSVHHSSNSPLTSFPDVESYDTMDKLEVRRKKHWRKARTLERDVKKSSALYESATPSPVDAEKLFNPAETEEFKLSIHPHRHQLGHRSSVHTTDSDCPIERIQFYKTFSLLIRMGNREKQSSKENEYQAIDNIEEQLCLQAIKDYLWLEVKAWQASCSPCDQMKTICMQRRFVPEILNKILTFCVTDTTKDAISTSDSGYSSSCCGNNAADMFPTIQEDQCLNEQLLLSAEHPSNKEHCDNEEASRVDKLFCNATKTIRSLTESLEKGHNDVSCVEYCLDNRFSNSKNSQPQLDGQEINMKSSFRFNMCGCNETLSRLCQNCISKETEALLQVTKVLDKLYETEHLYPCSKALGNEHPIYNSEEFTARVKTLNLWLNITTDMRRKIDSLAKLFEIQEKWKVGWPCYDPSEIFCSSPDEKRHFEEGENKSKLSLKIVQFQSPAGITSSPSTSGSDKGCYSIPVSPDVQVVSPFEPSSGSASDAYKNLSTSSSHSFNFKYGIHIYQRYVDKTLRHKGLKYIYTQLTSVLNPVLYRVHAALKRPKPTTYAAAVAKVVTDSPSLPTKFAETFLPCPNKEGCHQLSAYGVWSDAFQKMGLRTFHRPFLFLLHVPLDVVHHCLQLRIQQQPEEPSSLSVGQLLKECKEVLRAGIQIRQRYINLAQTIFGEDGTDVIEAQLNGFDEDLKTMLKIYLRYLEKKKCMMMMEELPGIAVFQKNSLEEEWAFVRATCPHIPGGEALAAKKFCFLASDLLNCIGIHVEREIENSLDSFDAITTVNRANMSSYRKEILHSCRFLKRIFNDAGDKARQAVAFAKTLRKDLEIATEYKMLVPATALLQKLQETGHIRVIAPHSSSHVMFVPGHLQYNETFIWQLVDMTCGHENIDANNDQDIYLLIMRYEACSNAQAIWQGPTILLEPTAEATITLSQIEVDGLLLVVNHSSHLMNQCQKFQRVMSKTLQIDKQQTSCNHAIAEALSDLKDEALLLCEKSTRIIKDVEKHLDIEMLTDLDEADKNNILASYREVLHQGYKFGFEYQKGVARLITGEARAKLGKLLIGFAHQWMKFVSAKCERGRGHRPRWATQGLEFLIAACDPEYLQNLTDDEFQELKQCMNNCITHLIGSPLSGSRVTSPTHQASPPSFTPWQCFRSSYNDMYQPSSPTIEQSGKSASYSSFPTVNIDNPIETNRISINKVCRVRAAIDKLEQKLQDRQECRKAIGRVSNIVKTAPQLHISARRVNFPWQRGFKIGEGRFGKVYTAVNNLTGELIAMKEIRLQPNDHRAIKEAMDEIRTFEGIKHPNIVHYYGVEIHKEEMLIFMEYCNEGSLESAAQLHLPETFVRKYTRNLLDAVNVLHEHGIVHRDIKSANVFLTSDGNLKLGDFGCCIKLKNHSTMPGELCSFVGTPAYMAPEIFTKNFTEGHGRAADIWSIGCVVLEMASGRRPWHDLDNSYQIMFRVGMGEIPDIPDTLSDEGQDFLNHCLQHDPHQRWMASKLLDHPFTKVNEDDDGI